MLAKHNHLPRCRHHEGRHHGARRLAIHAAVILCAVEVFVGRAVGAAAVAVYDGTVPVDAVPVEMRHATAVARAIGAVRHDEMLQTRENASERPQRMLRNLGDVVGKTGSMKPC